MFDLWKPARVAIPAASLAAALLLGAAPAHAAKHPKAKPSPTPLASASPAPSPEEAPEAPPLSAADMAGAVTLDEMTIPTPGELFAALNKQCKPHWSAEYRGPINTAYSDRSQVALNLGGLIADGFIAVEAMDSQEVKNLGRDILGLAKNLGISKEILARGNSITQFADDNDWNSLNEELESTQNEVKEAMDVLHDDELITLLTIGGWLRGTEVVSDVVLKNFSGQTASILRQPGIVAFLRAKFDNLPAKTKDTPLLKTIDTGLGQISQIVSFPRGDTASKEDVQKLHDTAAELVKAISSKTLAPQ
jgi:hypothetical protein